MNRYTYQFNASFKPKMAQIEGFVSIGTGGQVNFPDQAGLGQPSALSGQTGVPRGLLPGAGVLGVPTGWQGGFSGCIGLLGAGVAGVQRVATGAYVIQLEESFIRLDSIQVNTINAGTGIDPYVVDHTIGLGNSISTGGFTGHQPQGNNPKNCIFINFLQSSSNLPVDLQSGAGFYIDLRLRDSLSGPQ